MPRISVDIVLRKLKKLYKPPKTFLDFSNPFELLVATILSAQCTDARVNMVTPSLFRKYRRPEDYVAVPAEELENDIHSCGTYRNKARFIRELSKLLIKKHAGKVPETMAELITLPGVGRKTASVVLHAAFGKAEGIAVDTHVFRVARRLGLSNGKTPEKVEIDLMKHTPLSDWNVINTLMISHGRAVCTAINRKCEQCVFAADCPSSKVRGCPDLGKPISSAHTRRRSMSHRVVRTARKTSSVSSR